MKHIAIDIETLGTIPGSSILTIGAVTLSGDTFYVVADDPEGAFEPRAVRWHSRQEGAANNVGSEDEAVHIHKALTDLSAFLREQGAHRDGGAALWSHATFDVPQLAAAYHRAGIKKLGWHYRNCRDLRTLYDLAKGRPDQEHVLAVLDERFDDTPGMEFGAHHAMSDAWYHLGELLACYEKINTWRGE